MQTYTFFNKENSEKENVELVSWVWIAGYTDGTQLHQYNDLDFSFHQLREIDQEKLRVFTMQNKESGQKFDLLFPQNAKLIHFYRNTVLRVGQEDEMKIRTFCFGYELPHYKMLFMILPDNTIVATDDEGKVQVE